MAFAAIRRLRRYLGVKHLAIPKAHSWPSAVLAKVAMGILGRTALASNALLSFRCLGLPESDAFAGAVLFDDVDAAYA